MDRMSIELFGHGSLKLSPERQSGALLGSQVEWSVRTSIESSEAARAHHKQALEEALFPCSLLSPIPHL